MTHPSEEPESVPAPEASAMPVAPETTSAPDTEATPVPIVPEPVAVPEAEAPPTPTPAVPTPVASEAEASPAPPVPTPVATPPTPPPPPAPVRARPPLWPYFLTPAAVLLGAVAIVLAIVLTDGSDSDPAPPPMSPAAPVDTATTAATPVATTAPEATATARPTATATEAPEATEPPPRTSALLDRFDQYADRLALDVARFRQCSLDPNTLGVVNSQLGQGVALGVNGTPTFFVNNKRIVGALPASVFLEIIDAELGGNPPTELAAYSPDVQQLGTVNPPRFVIEAERPDLRGAAIKGSPDAPVVIVEYSDFQCPFCRRWFTDVLPELEGRIGDELALAFAHFPLSQIHPNAEAAHAAAECAGEQGKFWEMHDLLFERQWEWERLRN